jgi:membrane associated rhomboid family serine protease
MTQPETGAAPEAVPVCYRHTDRESHIRCQRCERPICPDCMRAAAVGFQCPECVKEGAKTTRQARTPYGGTRHAGGPVVTWTLLGLNLLVFVLVSATGGGASKVLSHLGLLPVGGVFADPSDPTGAYVVRGVSEGATWQLVTSMFTHVEIWHIFFNMMALYLLGPQLELALGRLRFAGVYLISGLVGSATVYWLAPASSLTIGASGAIFGLMGAMLVMALKVGGNVQGVLSLLAVNGVITVLGSQYISWQGHLGGLVGGVLMGTVMVYAPRERRGMVQIAGTVLVCVAILTAVVARTVVLHR